MIRRPNNWNEVKELSDRPKLPVGAYVCKVKKAAVQSNDYGEQLCVLFDIVEGEFKNFYDEDFKNNIMTTRKWKGIIRQWLPKDDGSEKDEWTKSGLKGLTTAFEKSNPGYQWNWDENSLAGKLIGVLFRNEEWEYEGRHGWTAKPFKAIPVENVRSGDYKIPNDKPLKKSTESSYSAPTTNYSDSSFEVLDSDDDLPF